MENVKRHVKLKLKSKILKIHNDPNFTHTLRYSCVCVCVHTHLHVCDRPKGNAVKCDKAYI